MCGGCELAIRAKVDVKESVDEGCDCVRVRALAHQLTTCQHRLTADVILLVVEGGWGRERRVRRETRGLKRAGSEELEQLYTVITTGFKNRITG